MLLFAVFAVGFYAVAVMAAVGAGAFAGVGGMLAPKEFLEDRAEYIVALGTDISDMAVIIADKNCTEDDIANEPQNKGPPDPGQDP